MTTSRRFSKNTENPIDLSSPESSPEEIPISDPEKIKISIGFTSYDPQAPLELMKRCRIYSQERPSPKIYCGRFNPNTQSFVDNRCNSEYPLDSEIKLILECPNNEDYRNDLDISWEVNQKSICFTPGNPFICEFILTKNTLLEIKLQETI